MRRLTHALLALAGVIMGTGVAVAAPVLHLSGWKASAGKPETFTITRVGGNGPATVTFRTTDGTATAPADYTAATQTISWRNGQTTLAITVPTFVNMAKAGTNIVFTATITSASGTSSATGLIVEPAAPPPPAPAPTPTPTPTPAPTTSAWIAAPLQAGGYAQLATSVSGAPKPGGFYPFTTANYASTYRTPAAGEVFKVDPNGSAYDSDNRLVWEVHPLTGEETLYFYASDLTGVAPSP